MYYDNNNHEFVKLDYVTEIYKSKVVVFISTSSIRENLYFFV